MLSRWFLWFVSVLVPTRLFRVHMFCCPGILISISFLRFVLVFKVGYNYDECSLSLIAG